MEILCHLHLHCADKPCYCKIQNISVLSSASFVVNSCQRYPSTSLPRKKKKEKKRRGEGYMQKAAHKKQHTSVTVELFTDTLTPKFCI